MQRGDLKNVELPDSPGVYLFISGKGKSRTILYVGKATSLRDRVRSYFDDDLIATRGPRVVDMVTRASGILFEPVPTVLEALVREAALIRKHRPAANALGKDDKSFLYAVITKEHIPRVLMIRGKDINLKQLVTTVTPILNLSGIYGPFPSGSQLKEALKLIRKIFPFYDLPRPVVENGKHSKADLEFNRQIGQYPRNMERKEYLRSTRNVGMFLGGRVALLKKTLQTEMHEAAKDEQFEVAGIIRKQLFALDHVQDVSLITDVEQDNTNGPRIEAYDTAHLRGTSAIGVMVVIEGSAPSKKDYRTFSINVAPGKSSMDDIASLKEILTRRLGHPEWQLPKAFVVDGGKTHKKAAEEILKEVGISIPVVAVVKDERHRPREVIGGLRAGIKDADAVLANSEAHRFSLTKHRQQRSREMLKKR